MINELACLLDRLKDEIKKEVIAELKTEFEATSSNKTLNLKEAAEYLHMSVSTLRELVHQKRIPHRRYGQEKSKRPKYFFSQRALDAWVREQETLHFERR